MSIKICNENRTVEMFLASLRYLQENALKMSPERETTLSLSVKKVNA